MTHANPVHVSRGWNFAVPSGLEAIYKAVLFMFRACPTMQSLLTTEINNPVRNDNAPTRARTVDLSVISRTL